MFHNMVHKTLSILTSATFSSLTHQISCLSTRLSSFNQILVFTHTMCSNPTGNTSCYSSLCAFVYSVSSAWNTSSLSCLTPAHPTVTPKLRYIALWRYHKVLYTLNHFPHHIVLIQCLSSPLTLNTTGTERLLFIFASCIQYLEHRFSVIVASNYKGVDYLFLDHPLGSWWKKSLANFNTCYGLNECLCSPKIHMLKS